MVMTENDIGKQIVNCAYKVHTRLGPGLLEYDEIKLDCGYRLDIFVESKVIVEIKAVEVLNDIHLAQILTYLKLSDCKLGFLINFNVGLIKNEISRVVNNLET